MSSLYDYMDGGTSPPVGRFSTGTNVKQVEPLGGTTDINELMERFPLEVYQRGRNSRLYRFVETLCGDSGAGQIQKQSYLARLRAEGENLVYKDLDTAYTNTFNFRRLQSETYDRSIEETTLTQEELDEVSLKDTSFRNRMQDFFAASRFGGSPTGMALAARAGSGVECEIVESYKAIFSSFSDDPLDLTITDTSVSNFIIRPRVTDRLGDIDDAVAYTVEFGRFPTYEVELSDFTIRETIGEIPWQSGLSQPYLKPDLARNTVTLIERLRPVGSKFRIETAQRRLLEHTVKAVDASSTRAWPVRFVTGREDVQWPETNEGRGFFIVSGEETESIRFAGSGWEKPVVFFTVKGVASYSEEALYDPSFNTNNFWVGTDENPAPSNQYRSTHFGTFDNSLVSIYPVLGLIPTDSELSESLSLALPFSPIEVVSRSAT